LLPKKEEIRDKVVLVGLNSPVLREDSATEESMDELSALVETAGGETAGIVLQNRPTPDPRTFIGEGKVAEVQLYVENVGATMVIFDNDLSPSQQRVLTELLLQAAPHGMGEVLFSAQDRETVGRAAVDAANGKSGGKLTLSGETVPIQGGFILKDGNVEVNCAFDTLVRLQKAETAGQVAQRLFG